MYVLEHSHFTMASDVLMVVFLDLFSCIIPVLFGHLACPRLILVWQMFFGSIFTLLPSSLLRVIVSLGLLLILGMQLSLKSKWFKWYPHFCSSSFPPEHQSRLFHSCASAFIFCISSCRVTSLLPSVIHVESSTKPTMLNRTCIPCAFVIWL